MTPATADANTMTTPDVKLPIETSIADPDRDWDAFVEKHGDQKMTLAATASLLKAVTDAMHAGWHSMNEKNKLRNQRLDALEQEVTALKSMSFLKDAGDWHRGGVYAVGDVARFTGSVWICTKGHEATGPTIDYPCWRLWIKRAKREAR